MDENLSNAVQIWLHSNHLNMKPKTCDLISAEKEQKIRDKGEEEYVQVKSKVYLSQIFSKYQCGFRKGYNAQHCLMAIIKKWHKFLDIGGHAGALLTDPSKAFDFVDHELLITKLHAYGFDNDA